MKEFDYNGKHYSYYFKENMLYFKINDSPWKKIEDLELIKILIKHNYLKENKND